MDARKLINWAELSRELTKGDRTGIQANRIPKKWIPKVRRLIRVINDWQKINGNG